MLVFLEYSSETIVHTCNFSLFLSLKNEELGDSLVCRINDFCRKYLIELPSIHPAFYISTFILFKITHAFFFEILGFQFPVPFLDKHVNYMYKVYLWPFTR